MKITESRINKLEYVSCDASGVQLRLRQCTFSYITVRVNRLLKMSWSWLGSDDEDETVEIGDDATSAVLIWFIIMPQCTMHFYMHFLFG